MKTKDAIKNQLITALQTPDFIAEEAITPLLDEIEERDTILSKYGETYTPGSDEWHFKETPVEDYKAEYENLQAKYSKLVKDYNDNFYAREVPPVERVSEKNSVDITLNDIIKERV